jgi:hypothetical protein
MVGVFQPKAPFLRYDGVLALAIPIGCAVGAGISRRLQLIGRAELALTVLILLIPHAYAFGTGRPLWLNAQGAAFFWMLGAAILLTGFAASATYCALVLLGSASLALTSAFVMVSMEFPMRQTQPLRLNSDVIELGELGRLRVSKDFANYIDTLRRSTHGEGFQSGTALVDLTGYSPGVALVVGAIPPGSPWLLGGHKASAAFRRKILDNVPCDQLASAWIVVESAEIHAADDTLARYGIRLNKDYKVAGSMLPPAAIFSPSRELAILKPRREPSEAQAACERARQ